MRYRPIRRSHIGQIGKVSKLYLENDGSIYAAQLEFSDGDKLGFYLNEIRVADKIIKKPVIPEMIAANGILREASKVASEDLGDD